MEEQLKKRQQELDTREIELLGRELNIMIIQNTPTPIKRRGKFSKSRLKVSNFTKNIETNSINRFFFSFFICDTQLLKREPGQISFPLDFRHTITVKHTALKDDPKTPPGSPAARYKAIARKFFRLNVLLM